MTDEVSLYDKIRTKLTRQGDVVANDTLYVRRSDPQTDAITKAEQRARVHELDAKDKQDKINALTLRLGEIKKKTATLNKAGDAYRQLATDGSRLIQQRKLLEVEVQQARQRQANFEHGAANLKRQKREEEDAVLLRELNVRMALGQEKLDVGELKELMGAARHVNSNVAQTTGILSGALELDAASPDQLLADFEAFELDDALNDLDALELPLSTATASSTTARPNSSVLAEY
jgi:hypothetical protein